MEKGGPWQLSQCFSGVQCPVEDADCCHVITAQEQQDNSMPAEWIGVEHAKACCTGGENAPTDCETCLEKGGSWQMNTCTFGKLCPLQGVDCCRVLAMDDIRQSGLSVSWADLDHAK